MSKEILVYDDNLPNTPGWASMSPEKQEWLQKQHSDMKKLAGVEGLAAVNRALKLYETKVGLKGEKMGITDYIENNYKGASRSTAFNRITAVETLLSRKWTPDLIRAFAERGALLLQGASGIALGDLVNVAEKLPAPKKNDPETIDAFIQGPVREEIRADRSNRRKRKKTLKEEDGIKLALIYLNRIFNEFGDKTSAERRAILKKMTGMTMEIWAIPGTIEVQRMSVPDELRPKAVGRPRGSAEEKAA